MYHKLFCWFIRFELVRNMFDNLLRNKKFVRLCNKPDKDGYVSYLRLSCNEGEYYYRWDGWVSELDDNDEPLDLDGMISLTKSFLSDNECQLRRTEFDWYTPIWSKK